jgi:integral membrane protein
MFLHLFRIVALLEGISFLVLLLIAMPLKYFADLPSAVQVVGAAHGALFVAYIIVLAGVTIVNKWSWVRVLGAIAAAFIPFGTFVLEARVRREKSA